MTKKLDAWTEFSKSRGGKLTVDLRQGFDAGWEAAIAAAEAATEQNSEPVAWVEVLDSYEGPYNFHGKKLLPVGKHLLYTRPQPTEAKGVSDG